MDAAAPGSGAEHERTLSADEVRERLRQMRSLPVEQVIGEAVFTLLNAARSRPLRWCK